MKTIILEIIDLLIFTFKERKSLLEVKRAMGGIKNKRQLKRFIDGLDEYIKESYYPKK